jgi:hypothetical protein
VVQAVEEVLNDALLPTSASVRPFPEDLHVGVVLHNGFQEAHQLLEHLTFASSTFLQDISSIIVVEVDPVAPQSAHGADPNLLGSLMLVEGPEAIIGLVLVEVEATVKIHSLHWYAFSKTCLAQFGVLLAEHLPDQGLAVIDGVGHVVLQVGVEVVDHIHHLLSNKKRQLLAVLLVLNLIHAKLGSSYAGSSSTSSGTGTLEAVACEAIRSATSSITRFCSLSVR